MTQRPSVPSFSVDHNLMQASGKPRKWREAGNGGFSRVRSKGKPGGEGAVSPGFRRKKYSRGLRETNRLEDRCEGFQELRSKTLGL